MKTVAAAVLPTVALAGTAQERRDPVGDRIAPGKDPARFFEMRLTPTGDSEWPGVGAISPR